MKKTKTRIIPKYAQASQEAKPSNEEARLNNLHDSSNALDFQDDANLAKGFEKKSDQYDCFEEGTINRTVSEKNKPLYNNQDNQNDVNISKPNVEDSVSNACKTMPLMQNPLSSLTSPSIKELSANQDKDKGFNDFCLLNDIPFNEISGDVGMAEEQSKINPPHFPSNSYSIISAMDKEILRNDMGYDSFINYLQERVSSVHFKDILFNIDIDKLGSTQHYIPVCNLWEDDFPPEIILQLQKEKLWSLNNFPCKLINSQNFLTMIFLSYVEQCIMHQIIPSFNLSSKSLKNEILKHFPKENLNILQFWFEDWKKTFLQKDKVIQSSEMFYKILNEEFNSQIYNVIETGVNVFRVMIFNILITPSPELKIFGTTKIWECVKFIIDPNDSNIFNSAIEEFIKLYLIIIEESEIISEEEIKKYLRQKLKAGFLKTKKIEESKPKISMTFADVISRKIPPRGENKIVIAYYSSPRCYGTFSSFQDPEERHSREEIQQISSVQQGFRNKFNQCVISIIAEVAKSFEEMLETYSLARKDPVYVEELINEIIAYQSEMSSRKMSKDCLYSAIQLIRNKVKSFFHINPNNLQSSLLQAYFEFWKRKTYKIIKKKRDEKLIGIKKIVKDETSICNLCYFETNYIKHHQCGHQFCDKCIRKYVRYMTNNEVIINFDINFESVKVIKCPINECYYCLSLKEIYLPFQFQKDIIRSNYLTYKDFAIRDNRCICHMCKGDDGIIQFTRHRFCRNCITNFLKYQCPNHAILKKTFSTFQDFAKSFQIVCPVHTCREILASDLLTQIMKELFTGENNRQSDFSLLSNYHNTVSISFQMYKTSHVISNSKCKALRHRENPILSFSEKSMKSEHPCTFCTSCMKEFENTISKMKISNNRTMSMFNLL